MITGIDVTRLWIVSVKNRCKIPASSSMHRTKLESFFGM